MINKIIEKAKKENKKVCIYAHKFPDGDAICSACAIVEYLKNNDIDAEYIITNSVNSYSKVTGEITPVTTIDENCISLIVDTSTLDYTENQLFLKSSPEDTFVIDHHIKAKDADCIEDELGLSEENVLRDSTASSTCEIVINELDKEKISPKIANMLTLGLITDTAKLKFIKANTLHNLQILLKNGANYEEIISMCTRKSSLRESVGTSKILLNSKKVSIGDTFGIMLPIDYETANYLNEQYGLKAIQKQIFKMSDITNCSFNCVFAENTPGEFDVEFRSSSVYGNLNVQQLATNYGGGGHYNASGCHLSKNDGYNTETISSTISSYVSNTYAKQATNLSSIMLTDKDEELITILDKTERLTKDVTTEILSKVDELVKNGANYDYTFKSFKTFEEFMIGNELLSRIPDSVYNQSKPKVDINLSEDDIDYLTQKYNVHEDEVLNLVTLFSTIDIHSASISLPNGKNIAINEDGYVLRNQSIHEQLETDENIR